MSGWDNFFIAQVGASAAFAGLVFVGVSINLTKIVAVPRQVGFALEALVVLLDVLITSSLLLVPGQPPAFRGGEVLVVGLGAWLLVSAQQGRTARWSANIVGPTWRPSPWDKLRRSRSSWWDSP